MLKYVKFYNIVTESMYDGFVTSEDENSFSTIDPICYEWLLYLDKLDWIEKIDPRNFDKEFFPYFEVKLSENWSFIRDKKWLFDFTVKEEYITKVHSIANFFELFALQPNAPLHAKINKAKERTSRFLSEEIQNELKDFIVEHYRNDPDRIRKLIHGDD